MEVKFKVGDWCFCEYKLQQVIEMEEGRITSVSDGRFRHGSYDLTDRCYPLDLRIKNVSDTIAYYMDELHKINHINLNYPDLKREFVKRWCEMCDVRKDDKKLQIGYDSLEAFYRQILDKVNALKYADVEGVSILR